jgi:hypothetical protein
VSGELGEPLVGGFAVRPQELMTGRPAAYVGDEERWLAYELRIRKVAYDLQRRWAQYDRHTFR